MDRTWFRFRPVWHDEQVNRKPQGAKGAFFICSALVGEDVGAGEAPQIGVI